MMNSFKPIVAVSVITVSCISAAFADQSSVTISGLLQPAPCAIDPVEYINVDEIGYTSMSDSATVYLPVTTPWSFGITCTGNNEIEVAFIKNTMPNNIDTFGGNDPADLLSSVEPQYLLPQSPLELGHDTFPLVDSNNNYRAALKLHPPII